MPIVILLAVAIIIWIIIAAARSNAKKNNSGGSDNITLRLQRKNVIIDQEMTDIIEVAFKGNLCVAVPNTPVDFFLTARDCTESVNIARIQTTSALWSSTGGEIFSPVTTVCIPYQITSYPDWSIAFNVPFDILLFPKQGMRKVEFCLSIQDKDGKILAQAFQTITVKNSNFGYNEYDRSMDKADSAALEILRIISDNGKFLTDKSSVLVSSWIHDRSNERDAGLVRIAENSMTEQYSQIKKSVFDTGEIFLISKCTELGAHLPPHQKFTFMEFFIKAVASFKDINAGHLKMLDAAALNLAVSESEYLNARQKHLPVHKIQVDDPLLILGISPELMPDEIKKSLRIMFCKWNSLAIHKDPQIREKAEIMLTTISKCQKQLSK